MSKLIANNKKARYEYFVEESYEAGIVLVGTEVKSIRLGKVSIKESYAEIKDGELFVKSMHISPYEMGSSFNVDPLRTRKLLLHKREIKKLQGLAAQDGYTLIPLQVYLNDRGLIKLQIGVCKGKKLYDKRESSATRDVERRLQKEFKGKAYE